MAKIKWLKNVPFYNAGTIVEVRDEYPRWMDVANVSAVMKGVAEWVGEPTPWAETVTLPLVPLKFRAYFPDYCNERPCDPEPKGQT